MELSGLGNSSVHRIGDHSVAFKFDLNKTPPPSPQEETGGNDGGATADHRCAVCGKTQGEMEVCVACRKHFHVKCLRVSEDEIEWKCADCLTTCRRRKRLRRNASGGSSGGGFELFDMNASPPPEVDADEVAVSFILGTLRLDDAYA